MDPVFLVEALPAGDRAVLDGEEARHAATVRRLRVGERLVLTDGRGGAARCVTESVQGGRDALLSLRVEESWFEPEPGLRVVVAQALAKGDRGELAVELATEAGVDEIVPWRAARSVAKWEDGPRGDKALARWRSTARAAAKQARRTWLPPVTEPMSTKQLAALAGEVDLALVLEAEAGVRLPDVALPAAGRLLLVIGPEGGIGADELAALSDAGARPVRLGQTVLRTSTAAAVALGALGALTPRWP
ncbi:16S rRNA (uracil(1498)-N(3))-methyltransferase [Amycolatopsis sp. 195334CR]|uniref:16S rRNA (uracil(1498)-N(3))-methyltransferase n=1 Tax=Amycolatopsis sp. 195334CR TaxID=2814588 RepID=UPI001A8FEEB9|nr:16S rRNA (uracil(1498)-N(3))-methyltransferase [Amycolatopsis sp. 195334CR]MBN6037554.1 16S rRNA (uracil(1498)-N(3))-methyltransferase [Amycolatopsis sp. 195334CR]